MTPQQEAEIRKRRDFNRVHRRGIGPAEQYVEDVSALLAAVERLRKLLPPNSVPVK